MTSRVPLLLMVAMIAALAFVKSVLASATDVDKAGVDMLQNVLVLSAVISLIVGIGYGLWNRKSYVNLNEQINDLNGLLKSKQLRIDEHAREIEQLEGGLRSKIAVLEAKIKVYGVSNEAVVSQNLQMKAILKNLRLEGVWKGDESIFRGERDDG